MKMSKEERYPLGYLPKIEYWSSKLSEATSANDIKGIKKAEGKISWFTKRELERRRA